MNKTFTLLLLCLFSYCAHAQQDSIPYYEDYGKITKAELKLEGCDFEKDANAEMLFNRSDYGFDLNLVLTMRHTRIKIFNTKGESEAIINIPLINGFESISDLKAETINLKGDSIIYTPVDKSTIYNEKINKYVSMVKFAFPLVKPGSVVEVQYLWHTTAGADMPPFLFENKIPTRYSQISYLNKTFAVQANATNRQPFVVDTYLLDANSRPIQNSHVWAMVDIPSFKIEPFMGAIQKNIQYLKFSRFHLGSVNEVKSNLLMYGRFSNQLDEDLTIGKDDKFIDSVNAIQSDAERIRCVFDRVKTEMNWNGINYYTVNDGVPKAWQKKSGNAAEINLILYNFLKQVGIKCYPMLLSTRDHGLIDFSELYLSSFNKTVVYVPLQDSAFYVLDASNKHNVFNNKPADLLNMWGVIIDEFSDAATVKYIETKAPAVQLVYVDAEIKPDGVLTGTSTVTDYNYNKINKLKSYENAGEKKYLDSLTAGTQGLKIISLKQENADVDTLPLVQNFDFQQNLPGSDGNYIYLNPNLFTALQVNPFLEEKRYTDIDMMYCRNYKIFGSYKIPAGYAVAALPKEIKLAMPDNSITFNRLIAEVDGSIHVSYIITSKRSYYKVSEYPVIYQFYKKMYEMLNEQILLKKS